MKIVNRVISVSLVIALVVTLNVFALNTPIDASTKDTRTNFNTQAVEGEADLLAKLNPMTGWRLAKQMVKIGSSDQGFRLAGTPEGKAAADMVYDKYEELGLTPEYDEFDVFGWRYLDSSFKVTDSDVKIDTVSVVGTPSTAGITAEIVDVGTATKQELKQMADDGKDLTGKIALLKLDLDVQEWHSLAINLLESKGAVGVIFYWSNYYAQDSSGDALNGFDWSGERGDIPAICTSKNSYDDLKAVLEASSDPVTGTMKSNVEIDENATGYNVIGQIKGSKYPDEYVIVNAHTDAYFQGFQDDTIAIGSMISIAEAMKKSNYKPDRTILFISMDGEEFGNMGSYVDYLSGSWSLLGKNNGKWAGKTVACMTIEYMAWEGQEKFDMRSSESLHDFISDASKSFSYDHYDGVGNIVWGASEYSDEWSFAYYGIPTFRNYPSMECNSTIYHSQFDNETRADYGKYAESTSHYAKLLMRLDKMTVTPYNLVPKVDNYINATDFDDLKSIDNTGKLEKLTADYKSKAQSLYDQTTEIMNLYNKAKQKGINLKSIDNELATYNQKVRDNIKLMATGTYAYEGIHNQVYEIGWYQKMDGLLDKAITSLESGSTEAALGYDALMGLPGTWYAQFQDKASWLTSNKDNLNPDNDNQFWMTDLTLEYFDHYDLIDGLREGTASQDYADEIAKCNEFKSMTAGKMDVAYAEQVELFTDLNAMFPADKGNAIIKTLTESLKEAPAVKETKTTSIKTAQKNIYLKKGQKITLPLTEYTNDGKKTKLTYKSSNKKIVTVTQTGKITAKKNGKATITVTSANGKKLKFKIYVSKKATKVKSVAVKYSKSMKVGKSQTLKVTIKPKKATKAVATFKSSKKSVLTVDKAGKITAKKKGTAKVTVKAGGKKKVIKITVK